MASEGLYKIEVSPIGILVTVFLTFQACLVQSLVKVYSIRGKVESYSSYIIKEEASGVYMKKVY